MMTDRLTHLRAALESADNWQILDIARQNWADDDARPVVAAALYQRYVGLPLFDEQANALEYAAAELGKDLEWQHCKLSGEWRDERYQE